MLILPIIIDIYGYSNMGCYSRDRPRNVFIVARNV